jgi:hypothetical protein
VPREFLFLLEQLEPGCKPLFTCSSLVVGHLFSPSFGCPSSLLFKSTSDWVPSYSLFR